MHDFSHFMVRSYLLHRCTLQFLQFHGWSGIFPQTTGNDTPLMLSQIDLLSFQKLTLMRQVLPRVKYQAQTFSGHTTELSVSQDTMWRIY